MKVISFNIHSSYEANPVFDEVDQPEISDRYCFDFEYCSRANGWAQLDTVNDAWYYGKWANIDRLLIVSYTEGDIRIVQCDNLEEFKEELYVMNEYEVRNNNRLKIDPGLSLDESLKYHKAGLSDLLHEPYQRKLNEHLNSEKISLEA